MSAAIGRSNNVDAEITDIEARVPRLTDYVFRSKSGTATLVGVFVNAAGQAITAKYTGTIANLAVTLLSCLSPSITAYPNEAAGFVGRLRGDDIVFNTSGATNSDLSVDMVANPLDFPLLEMADFFVLGRFGG